MNLVDSNNNETIKPKMKTVQGFIGQRYQVVAYSTLSGEPVVLGWTEDKTGGTFKFQADLNPSYKDTLVIDLEMNPRALANGFFIYQNDNDKTTKHEVLDYGVLKYKKMMTHVVVTSLLPPPLADAETVQDFMTSPRTVVFERKDFFNNNSGLA